MNGELFCLTLTDRHEEDEQTRLFYAEDERAAIKKAQEYRDTVYPGYRMHVERVSFDPMNGMAYL